MRQFKDVDGQTWDVDITVGAIKRGRTLLNVNLADVASGSPPLLSRLGTDYVLICDILYVVCKTQADARGVTDEKFGEKLGGDALAAGATALLESMADFFRSLNRGETVQAIEKMTKLIQAAVAAAEKKMSAIDADLAIQLISSKSATNAPESSASTPTPSPSGNSCG